MATREMVIAQPKYSTVIEATGPDGNIMDVLGKARVLLRQIGESSAKIDTFSTRVMRAESYSGALAIVREFFPVNADED